MDRQAEERNIDAMPTTDDTQSARWNGPSGNAWVDAQAVLDALYKPFEDLVVEEVAAVGGRRVLDVGCGTGATTLAVARLLGAAGRCTGIDVSEPMITAARARAGTEVDLIQADAQDHDLGAAVYDTIVSRFGVMFFDDPVAAFANLRRAARPGAALRFIAWRDMAANPFMTTAERAAAPLLPTIPARRPDGPGQFAFADRDTVEAILARSGWTGVDLRPIDVTCTLPEPELIGYVTRLGPLGQALPSADGPTRARVVETVRAAFEPYVHGAEVRFTAACWLTAADAQPE